MNFRSKPDIRCGGGPHVTGLVTSVLTTPAVDGPRAQWDLALWELEFADGFCERPCRTAMRSMPSAATGTVRRDHRVITRLRSAPAGRAGPKRPWPTQRSPPARGGRRPETVVEGGDVTHRLSVHRAGIACGAPTFEQLRSTRDRGARDRHRRWRRQAIACEPAPVPPFSLSGAAAGPLVSASADPGILTSRGPRCRLSTLAVEQFPADRPIERVA